MSNLLNAEMIQLGFTEMQPLEHTRLVICGAGREKRGKTTFALSAPGPIGVVTYDTGTAEIVRRVQQETDKAITLARFKVPNLSQIKVAERKDAEQNIRDYEPEWEKAKAAILSVVHNPKMRTLVVDTGTEVWELCRLARFGKLTQVKPQHYGPVNAEMREIVKYAYERDDLNAVWTQKVKKEYKESKSRPGESNWTGQFEVAGFGDTQYIVDFTLWHYFKEPTDDEKSEGARGHFGVRIMDCPRQQGHLFGEELEDDMCNFQTLACMIYPESSPDYWE